MKTAMIPGKLYCPVLKPKFLRAPEYFLGFPCHLRQVSLDNKPLLPVLLSIPLNEPCLFVCQETHSAFHRFLFDEQEVLVKSEDLEGCWEEWTDGES